jgi:capsular polysaccharide transport system ATP-binding protein
VLNSSSSAEPILAFDEFVLRADKADANVVISSPWNWCLHPGEQLSVMTTNSFLSYQLMATLSGLVEPISGEVITQSNLSWPLAGQGGLHSSLTINNGFEFLLNIYGDTLERSHVSSGEFFDALKSQEIDTSIPLKELLKDQKNFFFAALSILFSFDICIAPHSSYLLYLMSKDAKLLRSLFRKQLDGGLSMITDSRNNQFKRQFCNRGIVLGPLGEVIFDGDLDEAIAIGKQNDILEKRAEADEIKFDYGEKLTNLSPTSEDLYNDF